MNVRQYLASALLIAATAALPSLASAEPMTLPVQGRLVDPAGGLVDAVSLNLTLRLYRTQTGGTAVHTESHDVPVMRGQFLMPLGTEAPLDSSLVNGTELWVAVSIEGGTELSPRFPLATTPYVAYAPQANSVSWDNLSDVPDLVASAGGYVSGPGVRINASRQLSLDSSACFPGEIWQWNGSVWACGNPSMTVTGLDGIQAVAGYVSVNTNVAQRVLATHNCEFGIRSIGADGSVTCAANENTDTNVYGRACTVANQVLRGFDASGNPICVGDANTSANNRGCSSSEVLRGFDFVGNPICMPMATVDTNAFGRGCGGSQILRGFDGTGSPVCVTATDTNTNVFGRSCTGTNQVLRGFDGSGNPLCVTELDSNTTYTASNGLRISGTTLSVYDRRARHVTSSYTRNKVGNRDEARCDGTYQLAYGWQDDSCFVFGCDDYVRCTTSTLNP